MNVNGRRVAMFAFNSLDRDPRVWREAETLAQAGAHVDVYMLWRSGQPYVAEPVAGVTVTRPTARPPTSRKPWVAAPGFAAFVRATRRARYDVYHCHDGATLPLGVALARRRGGALVYDAHEYFADHMPAAPGESLVDQARRRYATDYLWERLLIRRADLCVTVASGIADELARRYRLPVEPTVVANRAAYWEPPPDRRRRLRREIGDATGPVMVFLGSARDSALAYEGDRVRGLETVIETLGRLPEAHLAIVGAAGDDYRRRVAQRARTVGAGDRVHVLGLRGYADYLELAAGGDVGVYLLGGASTSYQHAAPNRLFDFVMARLPVVVGSSPGIAAIVAEHRIGVALDAPDAAALAAAIEQITADATTGARLSRDLDAAAHTLSWEQESERLINAYASLDARS